MEETILWLIGIALAFAGVGIGMYYQGKAMVRPECTKAIGREMLVAGKIWIMLGGVWIIVAGVLIYMTD
ncbi:MAG: hypothetical protein HQ475_13370 [SAR202 cluster bacterium]|nr:hypothetical protein [SAR202 cluster bacterium]